MVYVGHLPTHLVCLITLLAMQYVIVCSSILVEYLVKELLIWTPSIQSTASTLQGELVSLYSSIYTV